MNDVANPGLSKELYDLSGWTTGRVVSESGDTWSSGHRPTTRTAPAYDLGYLLRKLPEVRLETWHNRHVVTKYFTKNGVPEKLERKGEVVIAEANTPEDAACKLAIELFKQGILKKEGQDETN